MEQKEIVAANLTNYRKKAGISQLELAKKLNYSNKNISKWENGETTPSVFVLKEIANVYGITIDDLLNESTIDANQLVEAKAKVDKRKKQFFRVFMLLLANVILFCATSIAIYVMGICNVTGFNKWLLYFYTAPLVCISVVIYIRVLYKFLDPISLSLMGWLLCGCIYVSLINVHNISLIFVLGAGFQLLVICLAILLNLKTISKYALKIKNKILRHHTKQKEENSQSN